MLHYDTEFGESLIEDVDDPLVPIKKKDEDDEDEEVEYDDEDEDESADDEIADEADEPKA